MAVSMNKWIKSEIKTNVFCNTCLSTDRMLLPITKHIDLCTKLFSNVRLMWPVHEMVICWECMAYLKNVHKFLRRTEFSQMYLHSSYIYNKEQKLESQSTLRKYLNMEYKTIVYDHEQITTKEIKEEMNDLKIELDDYTNYESPTDFIQDAKLDNLKNIKTKHKRKCRRPKTDYDNYYRTVQIEDNERELILKREKETSFYLNSNYRCEKCVLIFSDHKSFNKHKKLHHVKSGNFLCNKCEGRFKTAALLDNHIRNHYTARQCSVCSLKFYTINTLVEHYKESHLNRFDCSECGFKCGSSSEARRHHKAAHTTFICDYCEKKYFSKILISKHIIKQHETKYECRECNITFKSAKVHRSHYDFKHKLASSDEAYCVECDIKFDTLLLYKRHIHTSVKHVPKKSHEVTSVNCPICSKRYTRKTFMMNHYRLEHLKRTKHYCVDCDKYFLNATRIKEHRLYVHEGRRRALNKVCYICGRAFADTRSLQHHIHTHTGERPHACPHCPAKFIQKYAMQKHVSTIHLKMKKCEITSKIL